MLQQGRRSRGQWGALPPPPPPQFQAKNKKLNNESSISELPDFKIFWARIPPKPPTR